MSALWRERFRSARTFFPAWARSAPDRLLYDSDRSGKWELHVWDLAADVHRQVTDRPLGTTWGLLDHEGDAVWWFDDDEAGELGRWRRTPFAGGPSELATDGVPDGYSSGLAFGPGVAVVGCVADDRTRVYRCRDGEPARLLYEHAAYAEVESVDPTGRLVCLSHRERGDGAWPDLRVLDLDGVPVADLPAVDEALWPGEWSPAGGEPCLLVHREPEDALRPALWHPRRGELRDVPIDLDGDVSATWFPEATALLLTQESRGRTRLHRLELAGRALARIPHPPGSIYAAAVRPDGEIWYQWTDGATPHRLHCGSRSVDAPDARPMPGGAPYADLEVGDVHGFLCEGEGPRPKPTVVLAHGGPHMCYEDAFSPRVQAWADHGFLVALVNYRGSTGYGKAWRDAIVGDPGFTELRDLVAVRDHLVAAGLADPARLVLSGSSWGGYLTLLGLGVEPGKWSLGIAEAPIADYAEAYAESIEEVRALDRALVGGTPEEVPERYAERSPISYVERVRAPVLVAAGENDPRCPIGQVERYVARLRELGKPHELLRYGTGHDTLVAEMRIEQIAAWIDFAARHLGTPRAG